MMILALTAATALDAIGAPPAGWKTCGGLPDGYANTACPTATQSCAPMAWEPSTGAWGCCPFPDGVSCSKYTCCPKGTTCQNRGHSTKQKPWTVVSTCVSAGEEPVFPQFPHVFGADANITGDQVCKTGPPLPYSKTLKNVLVVGDSVSIGYTPFVAKVMAATAFVQHSPWGGDGGAEETLYGARCIDNLVRAPDGTLLSPDVLMFNWGLHNSLGGNCSAPCDPGQSGPPREYAPYLQQIVDSLQKAPQLQKTKLLFAVTSPDLCNAPIDAIQCELNAQAKAIMAKAGIPIVDLYAAITGKCGKVPQAQCFGSKGCFCPHCPGTDKRGLGYSWLANTTIVPAIAKLL